LKRYLAYAEKAIESGDRVRIDQAITRGVTVELRDKVRELAGAGEDAGRGIERGMRTARGGVENLRDEVQGLERDMRSAQQRADDLANAVQSNLGGTALSTEASRTIERAAAARGVTDPAEIAAIVAQVADAVGPRASGSAVNQAIQDAFSGRLSDQEEEADEAVQDLGKSSEQATAAVTETATSLQGMADTATEAAETVEQTADKYTTLGEAYAAQEAIIERQIAQAEQYGKSTDNLRAKLEEINAAQAELAVASEYSANAARDNAAAIAQSRDAMQMQAAESVALAQAMLEIVQALEDCTRRLQVLDPSIIMENLLQAIASSKGASL